MKRQIGFAEAESKGAKRVTRRQRFLAEMEKVVPWPRLLSAIEPYYPKGKRGRPPIGLERMLRIYFLQQWYGLSDEGLEDALYDSIAMRAFAGIDLAVEDVPDATTSLKFPPPAGRACLDAQAVRRDRHFAVRTRLADEGRHVGRCDDYRGAGVDQERREQPRSRDASNEEGQRMAFWHEGAYRRRCRLGSGA
ncbi:hypothetical protein HDG38_006795 [Paraburkholderia sp. WSM4177]|nr:hypothetical protein [Paraburkholderia sp. WSM4177]MBB5488582.1 hypothetical protein [Paraburkholderia sp. WSM4180]